MKASIDDLPARLLPETMVRPQGDRRLRDCPSVERARRSVARGRVRRGEGRDDRAGGQDAGRNVPEGPVVVVTAAMTGPRAWFTVSLDLFNIHFGSCHDEHLFTFHPYSF